MPELRLRACRPDDQSAVAGLWRDCGLHPSHSDGPEGLAKKLARDPELFLVAEEEGRIVGTVMGSYDGRRGWINRLAVRPDRQGSGIATVLMAEVERRLAAIGCEKVNLLIEPDNAKVESFYARLGYASDPLIFMEKWLV
jgi:ribosomal protein S18 acetylase RimI-like enzyme